MARLGSNYLIMESCFQIVELYPSSTFALNQKLHPKRAILRVPFYLLKTHVNSRPLPPLRRLNKPTYSKGLYAFYLRNSKVKCGPLHAYLFYGRLLCCLLQFAIIFFVFYHACNLTNSLQARRHITNIIIHANRHLKQVFLNYCL